MATVEMIVIQARNESEAALAQMNKALQENAELKMVGLPALKSSRFPQITWLRML